MVFREVRDVQRHTCPNPHRPCAGGQRCFCFQTVRSCAVGGCRNGCVGFPPPSSSPYCIRHSEIARSRVLCIIREGRARIERPVRPGATGATTAKDRGFRIGPGMLVAQRGNKRPAARVCGFSAGVSPWSDPLDERRVLLWSVDATRGNAASSIEPVRRLKPPCVAPFRTAATDRLSRHAAAGKSAAAGRQIDLPSGDHPRPSRGRGDTGRGAT